MAKLVALPHKQTRALVMAHIIGMLPVLFLSWQLWYDGWPIDPIASFTTFSGDAALNLLVASLAITPMVRFGLPKFIAVVRRPIGLYAFCYSIMHVLVYVWLDYGWDWQLMSQNMFTKRYLFVGLAAFFCLVPLALTSTQAMQKRLGRWWKRLHQLNYIAALLAATHFIWLVKSDIREPLVYAGVILFLLGLRLFWFFRQKNRHISLNS